MKFTMWKWAAVPALALAVVGCNPPVEETPPAPEAGAPTVGGGPADTLPPAGTPATPAPGDTGAVTPAPAPADTGAAVPAPAPADTAPAAEPAVPVTSEPAPPAVEAPKTEENKDAPKDENKDQK